MHSTIQTLKLDMIFSPSNKLFSITLTFSFIIAHLKYKSNEYLELCTNEIPSYKMLEKRECNFWFETLKLFFFTKGLKRGTGETESIKA